MNMLKEPDDYTYEEYVAAMIIQMQFRAYQSQKAHRIPAPIKVHNNDLDYSAKVIQKHYRSFKTRQNLIRNSAATIIQRNFRYFLKKKNGMRDVNDSIEYADEEILAAMIIQMQFRAYQSQKAHRIPAPIKVHSNDLDYSAKVIQKHYRSFKTRQNLIRNSAATIIQRNFRCFLEKKNGMRNVNDSSEYADEELLAAMIIQIQFRVYLEKKRSRQDLSPSNSVNQSHRLELQVRRNAATKIQRRYRKHRENRAAIFIQRNFRKHMFQKRNSAAIAIQSKYRTRLSHRNRAASKIQRWYKRRKLEQERESAAIIMQKQFRDYTVKKKIRTERENAALKIQQKYRHHLLGVKRNRAAGIIQQHYRVRVRKTLTKKKENHAAKIIQREYRLHLKRMKSKAVMTEKQRNNFESKSLNSKFRNTLKNELKADKIDPIPNDPKPNHPKPDNKTIEKMAFSKSDHKKRIPPAVVKTSRIPTKIEPKTLHGLKPKKSVSKDEKAKENVKESLVQKQTERKIAKRKPSSIEPKPLIKLIDQNRGVINTNMAVSPYLVV